LSNKDNKIDCFKNHSKILLTKVKKLKCKDISILNVDKDISMDMMELWKFLEVKTTHKETLTQSIESRKILEVETTNKETLMELIETKN
jgi:hypothetical protein